MIADDGWDEDGETENPLSGFMGELGQYATENDLEMARDSFDRLMKNPFVLGAELLSAGWETARIRPALSGLAEAKGKIPTPRGPVTIHWIKNSSFNLKIELPPGMTAMVEIPAADPSSHVFVNSKETAATLKGARLCLTQPLDGSRVITLK